MRLRRKMRSKKSKVERAAYATCSIIVAAVIYYLIRQVALVFFQPLWPVDDYRDRGIRGIGDGWLRRKRWPSGPNSEDFLAIASPYRLAAAGGKNPEL